MIRKGQAMDIKLPFLGDGVASATVLSVLVAVGDTVQKDQTLLELETDKAVAPIPSPSAGTVTQIITKVGDTVSTGTLALVLSGSDSGTVPAAPVTQPVALAAPVAAPTTAPVAQAPSGGFGNYVSTSGIEAPASPTVRRIAEQTGLDLSRVVGTASGGRITLDDLRQYVSHLQYLAFQKPVEAVSKTESSKTSLAPLPDFSKWGAIDIKPISSLRKKIGEKMAQNWHAVPHVTQFGEADITDLMALRKKHVADYAKKDIKLTVTVLILKAVVAALKEHAVFNASFDDIANTIIYKQYIHLGVAVDTEAGLMVPVIRDVDKKSIAEISEDLNAIAEKARKRQISLEDLQGGSFTVSNLGGLGAGPFTPIVNTPDTAILGLSKGQSRAVFKDGNVVERIILPISVSYDHRVIDGADGARFMQTLITTLETFPESWVKG
jgi:pyruvate dehydrogenase E2 component (dihydrolipoamide acetyltransferase)